MPYTSGNECVSTYTASTSVQAGVKPANGTLEQWAFVESQGQAYLSPLVQAGSRHVAVIARAGDIVFGGGRVCSRARYGQRVRLCVENKLIEREQLRRGVIQKQV